MNSPIALFVYNRPDHTRKTVEALLRNPAAKDSRLFIFSDAAKNDAALASVAEVRSYIRTIAGFAKIEIIERIENFGLAKSITDGVGRLTDEFGTAIILEDDIVVSPFFLQYMNDALALYANDEKVASIHGYVYPIKDTLPETFFIKDADCWGWATWKRAWKHFNPDALSLLAEIKQRRLEREFDFNDSYDYVKMLERRAEGKNNAWAACWYASAFLKDMLTLYPGRSLVQNIGNDGGGTHSGTNTAYDVRLSETPIRLERLPIEENAWARKSFAKFFRSLRPSVYARIKKKLGL